MLNDFDHWELKAFPAYGKFFNMTLAQVAIKACPTRSLLGYPNLARLSL
jgi:hypothetical protein